MSIIMVTALLVFLRLFKSRYNSYTIIFTLLKYMFNDFYYIYTHTKQPSHYTIIEHFHHSKKKPSTHQQSLPIRLSFQQSTNLLSVFMDLPFLNFCIHGIIYHVVFCFWLLIIDISRNTELSLLLRTPLVTINREHNPNYLKLNE